MLRLAIAVCVMGFAGPVRAAGPEKVDLFTANTGGYALYRIPGVVVTARGTILAYCEARKSDRSDWGTIDVVMRRSADGGKTWDEPGTSPGVTIGAISAGGDAGQVVSTTDPLGLVSRSHFDTLSRTTETAQDFTDGVPTNASNKMSTLI